MNKITQILTNSEPDQNRCTQLHSNYLINFGLLFLIRVLFQDIVHLDLKPENVVLVSSESNRLKIIDFGFAKKLNSDSQVVRVLQGTPEFVPPEIVNYEPIGFPSDTWSIGVIAYVLLTGLSPFLGKFSTTHSHTESIY